MRFCDICKRKGRVREIQIINIKYIDFPESDRMNRKIMSKKTLEIHIDCLLKLLDDKDAET